MKFIDIRIECLEDLKVTSALNQVNSSDSLAYIAGSAIRGAFISNYIKRNNVYDINENEESKKWFFKNGLEFLNGYIEYAGERTLPIPQGLYTNAINLDNYHCGEEIEIKNQLVNKIIDTDKKFSASEFIYIDDDNMSYGVGINKVFNLHIRKGEDRQMFRYEAIEKGQIFRAIIKAQLSNEEIDSVIDILENGEFYIGGSKGSGYGKVKISVVDKLDNNPEVKIGTINNIKNEIIILTTADGIFIDDFGNSISHIDPMWLEENLEIENVKLVTASTEEVLVGGYNKKWGTRIPQYTAVKKGSIFKYSFDGEIEKEKLIGLQNYSLGLRTEEGYGTFVILSSFNIKNIKKARKITRNEGKQKIKFNDEEREQVQFIVNSLARKKVESKMKEIIVSNYSIKGKVNKNQIGKLVQLFSLCQKKNMKDGIEFINNYFEHLRMNTKSKNGNRGERINQDALHQLKDLIINNKKSNEFIKGEIEKISVESFVERYSMNSIKINKMKPIFDLEEVYIYKMIELENMFRYILRSR